MNELVLDASVLVKWFKSANEDHIDAAQDLYGRFSRGERLVIVPPLIFLELLNAAPRRWGWDAGRLESFAIELDRLGLVVRQPPLRGVARWCARGLTSYDAAHVALAEELRTQVVTDDDRIIRVAGRIGLPLGRA